jgi:hypothetical protein
MEEMGFEALHDLNRSSVHSKRIGTIMYSIYGYLYIHFVEICH